MYRHWSILYRNQSTHVSTPTAQLTVVSLKVTTLIDSCTEPGRLINRSWFARVPTKIGHLLATLDSCNNIRRPNCAFCEMWAVSATRMLPLFYFCSFMFFDLPTKFWNPWTYRYKIVRLSSAQFGLVMNPGHSGIDHVVKLIDPDRLMHRNWSTHKHTLICSCIDTDRSCIGTNRLMYQPRPLN